MFLLVSLREKIGFFTVVATFCWNTIVACWLYLHYLICFVFICFKRLIAVYHLMQWTKCNSNCLKIYSECLFLFFDFFFLSLFLTRFHWKNNWARGCNNRNGYLRCVTYVVKQQCCWHFNTFNLAWLIAILFTVILFVFFLFLFF